MERKSGLLLHLTSLPASGGIGDLGPCAYCFADRLAGGGQGCWQVLPLNPSEPENGESPYFSASAFAMNPLLASPEVMARDGLIDISDIAAPPTFPADEVDYAAARVFKTTLVNRAYKRFDAGGAGGEFTRFCGRQAWWLDDYCLFQAIKREHGGGSWTQWPRPLRDRDPAEMQRARSRHVAEIRREQFAQWIVFSQWFRLKAHCAEKNIIVIGDLPIYVGLESADVWANPRLFKLDNEKLPAAVSGVPPDYFSATGQLWNNPVYDWEAMRRDGFGWWERRLRATFERFDIVRIDHFRGLVQYWEVPAGETTAINGSWRDVPTVEFLDSMIERFPAFPVIAEDLGTITPDVKEIMRRYGFPGMKVLQFAFGEDNPDHPYLPHTYEENCVAYAGTHDNTPLRAWLERQSSPEERRRLSRYLGGDLPPQEEIRELISRLMQSKAGLVVLPLQDLLALGVEARMNDPATARGNWKWRCTPEQFEAIPWDWLRQLTEESGRTERRAGRRANKQEYGATGGSLS
jgi:4-alpha-glucanotransferase